MVKTMSFPWTRASDLKFYIIPILLEIGEKGKKKNGWFLSAGTPDIPPFMVIFCFWFLLMKQVFIYILFHQSRLPRTL